MSKRVTKLQASLDKGLFSNRKGWRWSFKLERLPCRGDALGSILRTAKRKRGKGGREENALGVSFYIERASGSQDKDLKQRSEQVKKIAKERTTRKQELAGSSPSCVKSELVGLGQKEEAGEW